MCASPAPKICLTLLVVCIVLRSPSFAQQPFPTSRFDSARDNANIYETLLTPANVNKNSFGHLFSFPVDPGVAASPNADVMAQPLYMPNVNIVGQGTHNVVYIVTMADSVYAIDADTGAELWHASTLNVGGTPATVSDKTLPCGLGIGFDEEGIVGTPVIDPTTNTMYLVAKTALNGTVRHHIHALDITSGNEQPGSPVQITAQSTSKKGHVTVFNSLHQKNRPGLLLLNGVLYMGFGSNSCNDDNSGWVLSYNASAAMGSPEYLAPLAVFNTSPDWGLTSIWQAGTGLAADEAGNIFFETAEVAGAGHYDLPTGGQTYCNSVVKLYPDLTVYDYFTPWTVAYLNTNDLDLSSTGVLILPDQDDSPTPHELVASGKQGWVYVLDRDSLGMYSAGGPTDPQVVQEFPLLEKSANPESDYDVQFGSAAYWNETVYFAPDASPLLAYSVSGGKLGIPPAATAQKYSGSHSPSISANGNTNGIVWAISGGELLAFNACTASAPAGTCQNQYAPLELLYSTIQAPNKRDAFPPVGHFVTQTVTGGKLFVATQTSLEAYGLFPVVAITEGNAQTATVGTALPNPIQIQIANPYNGQPDAGATVNFSDGGKGGVFSPSSGPGTGSVTTDANGNASIGYTVPQKAGTYTLTMSGTGFGNTTTTATATAGAAIKIISYGGAKQTGTEGSILPNPIVAQAQDAYRNGVSGVTINFTANNGAVPNPSSVVTDANGLARTTLQLPDTVSTVAVTASSAGFKNVTFVEYSVAAGGMQSPPVWTPATTPASPFAPNPMSPRETDLTLPSPLPARDKRVRIAPRPKFQRQRISSPIDFPPV